MSISVKALLACLLLSIGAAGGFWQAETHYRPLLDTAQTDLATVTTGRNNLEALTTEQGQKLGELVRLGEEREALAKAAQGVARTAAKPYYAAANQLLRERTGGDQCAAATAVIDQELFGL